MLRMFIPLPLTTSERVKIVKRRQQKTPSTIEGVNYTGDFVAVKDYEYIRVAKSVGETQVGVNLFYLVDKKVIVGYRTYVGYYLRQGANGKRSIKQDRLSAVSESRRRHKRRQPR